MKAILNGYQVMIDLLQNLIIVIACLLIGLDVFFIFVEVASRYLIGSSQAVLEEFPRLMLPFVVFPMMGVLLKKKRHIAVEILPDLLTARKRSLLLILVYSVVLALSIQFFIAGATTVHYFYEIGFEIQGEITIKNWVACLPFPIGFGLLGLFAVDLLVRELGSLIQQSKGNPL